MNLNGGGPLPLAGVRVLDWTTMMAAPTCGRMLADLGADVVKVETLNGDTFRVLGEVYNVPSTPESNPMFTLVNSNKRFISIDQRTAEGKEILLQLLEGADVFLTNVRLKVQQAMGLSYEDLKERFPRLVFAHLTGFGYNGEEYERPGYDVAAFWARSGGQLDWVSPHGMPTLPGIGAGDITSGTTLFSGIMAALYAREKTGHGTLVTTSLMGTGIWVNGGFVFVAQPAYGGYATPQDPEATDPFTNNYRCKDGVWVTLVIPGTPRQNFEKRARVFGLEGYLDDPRFLTSEQLLETETRRVLCGMMREAMAGKTFAEWREVFLAEEIVHEEMRHSGAVTGDPQAIANGYVQTAVFPDGREASFPTVPVQFSEYRIKPVGVEMTEGKDTRAVLTELGYTAEQIEDLFARKTVR